jgi:hypothetical protein
LIAGRAFLAAVLIVPLEIENPPATMLAPLPDIQVIALNEPCYFPRRVPI